MYYHIDPQTLTVIAGPYDIQDPYFRKLTSCGNPEALNLATYGIVPQVWPTLQVGNQYNGQTTVYADRVEMVQAAIPLADAKASRTAEIAAYSAQRVEQRWPTDERVASTAGAPLQPDTPDAVTDAVAHITRRDALVAQVETCTTSAQVYSIDITTGWPT